MSKYFPYREFIKYTRMFEDDPMSTVAWVEFIEQDMPLEDWWAEYKEDIYR